MHCQFLTDKRVAMQLIELNVMRVVHGVGHSTHIVPTQHPHCTNTTLTLHQHSTHSPTQHPPYTITAHTLHCTNNRLYQHPHCTITASTLTALYSTQHPHCTNTVFHTHTFDTSHVLMRVASAELLPVQHNFSSTTVSCNFSPDLPLFSGEKPKQILETQKNLFWGAVRRVLCVCVQAFR
jgi:hypothetical protein